MHFDAAIFDLDGTLLDSMDVWEKIDITFLHKRGLTVPANYVTGICTRSFEEAAQYTIDLFRLPESVKEIVDEWKTMAEYEYTNNIKLSLYAFEYLIRLKDAGIKLAVATGLPEELYEPCLKNNKVHALFDVLCSTDEVIRGKEYPDIFELVAQRLELDSIKCVVFEDVLPAVRSAKQVGMMVYGVHDKYSVHNRSKIEIIAEGYLLDFQFAPFPNNIC